MIAARREAQEALAAAQARIDRLTEIGAAVGPARARLSALDGDEASAFADWSLAPPGAPVPIADKETRDRLNAELDAAMAQAAAAERARASVQDEAGQAARNAAAVDAELSYATGYVALEELEDIEQEAKAVMRKMADVRMKAQTLSQVIDSVRAGRNPGSPGFNEFSATYADAVDHLAHGFDLPNPDQAEEDEFRAKAFALMTELRDDAGSRIHIQ
jgi:hypothetical protein